MLAMARKSSKLKLFVIREPSGRPSRSGTEPELSTSLVKRLRDAAAKSMADAFWGSEPGRLYLAGKITEAMLLAAERWGELVVDYGDALDSPPQIRSAALQRGSKGAPPDVDSDTGRAIARREGATIDKMLEAHAVLKGAGRLAEVMVRAVCEHDEPATTALELDSLRAGLSWLVQFWGLTNQRRDGRKLR